MTSINMKILHIHTKMTGGGIQAMVAGLTNEMVKHNDVTLLLIYKPDFSR